MGYGSATSPTSYNTRTHQLKVKMTSQLSGKFHDHVPGWCLSTVMITTALINVLSCGGYNH